jgi:hypothetical protein
MNEIKKLNANDRERKFPRFHAITGTRLRRNMTKDLHTLMPRLIEIAESGTNPLSWLLSVTPQSLEFRAMLIDLAESVGGEVWPPLGLRMSPSHRRLSSARTLRAIDRELVAILKGWTE